jgi:hypothetical protein
MTSWYVLKARAAWLFGLVLAAAGTAAALYGMVAYARRFSFDPRFDFMAQLLQSTPELPQLQPAMLTEVEAAAAYAVAGIAAAALGAWLVYRQAVAIRRAKQRREDARRRVRVYRESMRKEPFIGADYPETERRDASRRRVA